MSASGTATIAPLAWPPTSNAAGRWMPRVMGALAVELDACWTAHELARCLGEKLDSETLAERLGAVVSAAVVCHDTSDVIALLEAHAPDAAAHLRAAAESRLRALGTLRDGMWLARHRLLDRSRLRAAIEQVVADLTSAGRSIAGADRALLDGGLEFAGVAQRRE